MCRTAVTLAALAIVGCAGPRPASLTVIPASVALDRHNDRGWEMQFERAAQPVKHYEIVIERPGGGQ